MSPGEAGQQPQAELLRIEKAVYGGDGLARSAAGRVVFLPFVLPGERISFPGPAQPSTPEIRHPSPDRVEPRCVHFGVCGGCQYQMANYGAQLSTKAAILRETLARAGLEALPGPQLWGSPEPYGYRNRIRLRVRVVDGSPRCGYSVRRSNEFLPVTMCPIAAPVLWSTAETILRTAARHQDAADWLRSASEIELLCDETGGRTQVHLLCPGQVPRRKGSFDRFAKALESAGAPVASLAASRLHAASGRALASLGSWGAEGLSYRVAGQTFWLQPGSFFQVNRFLLPEMVRIVCGERSGRLAWDLFAGVGLFARELTERFEQVTAVEANPAARNELQRGLRASRDRAVSATTLAFLREAVVQRERPELIVLDPPRAGAGEEACALLLRLAPQAIVYVSCDPTTLARDLAVLSTGYRVSETHMIDLFPQTYHLETVMVLRRNDLAS